MRTRRCLTVLVLAVALAACGCDSGAVPVRDVENGSESWLYGGAKGTRIILRTDDAEVTVELNGTRAAAELVQILPLKLEILDRAEFAKSVKLPQPLFDGETPTREYSVGDFGYWPPGPDLAIFYSHQYEQTLVEEIPLGHALTDAAVLANAEGVLTIELER